jgi:hypothetical protein
MADSGWSRLGTTPDGSAVFWAPVGTPLPRPVEACPECQQGKHGNCDGTSWDDLRDEPTDCPCARRDHG